MGEPSPEFAGLAALVTGGASGIGLATARLLAARGARVAVLDRAKADAESSGLYPLVANVTDDAEVRAAVAEAGRALGGLDILVNNAGIGAAGTVEDNGDDEWHRVLDVNVLGIVRTARAALPLLRQAARDRGQAVIVNTCSVAATAAATEPRRRRGRPPRSCRGRWRSTRIRRAWHGATAGWSDRGPPAGLRPAHLRRRAHRRALRTGQ